MSFHQESTKEYIKYIIYKTYHTLKHSSYNKVFTIAIANNILAIAQHREMIIYMNIAKHKIHYEFFY